MTNNNSNDNTVVRISKTRLANIIVACTLIILVAFLYLVYKPDNITLLNIIVGYFVVVYILRGFLPDSLDKRIKKLEDKEKQRGENK